MLYTEIRGVICRDAGFQPRRPPEIRGPKRRSDVHRLVHPMFQPVEWTQPPESLAREVAPDRLDVYRIVLNSAIAVTLRAPYLNYERTLFAVGDRVLSSMAVTASPYRQGYWPFRQDFPASPWPQAMAAPAPGAMKIIEARAVRAGGVSLGELILKMEDLSIGTPATTAGLLQDAIENTARRLGPTLTLEWRNSVASYDQRWMVRLSPSGVAALDVWRSADLVADSTARQLDIERVAQGEGTPFDVLVGRFSDVPKDTLERVSSSISGLCDRWRGLSQEDGLRALTKQQARPPKLSGLPRWIDPEHLLPEDHPLRKIREEMEGDLAVQHPTWPTLTGNDKAALRLNWLQNKRATEPSIPPLESEGAQFNALTHWLLGQPMR